VQKLGEKTMSDTPVAQWAFKSIFNRQTPMSKYTQMKQQCDELDDAEDTFHHRRLAGTRQYSKSQDTVRDDLPKSTRTPFSQRRRAYSMDRSVDDYTLPHEYPGKFPKGSADFKRPPLDDLLTSSATRSHLKDANSNMHQNILSSKVNRSMRKHNVDQATIIAQLDQNNKDLGTLIQSISQDDDLQIKYQALKLELSNELIKSQKLYDAYFRDVKRHNELKRQYKQLLQKDSSVVKKLQNKCESLELQNLTLSQKLKDQEFKLQEDDYTLNDLKQTLQNTSNFEVTLRRKVKYLEDKLEQEREMHRQENFELQEKIYLMDTKAKEDEERLRSAELHLMQLEGHDDHENTIDKLIKETGI
jgi:hypothetical protein